MRFIIIISPKANMDLTIKREVLNVDQLHDTLLSPIHYYTKESVP